MRVFAAAALLACALYGVAAQAGAPAVFRLPAPPPGFKPAQASNEELARYGLPARPTRLASNTKPFDTWTHAMAAARTYVAPEVRLTGRRRSTVEVAKTAPRRSGLSSSYNWAGEVITSGVGTYGSGSFTEVLGQWVLTAVQQAIGTCNPVDVSAVWVGLDGYLSSDVAQAGTEADAYCSAGNLSTDYYAWFEWAPDYEYEVTNFAVYPGMPVFVVVQAYGATTATATFVNMQSNEYTTVGFNAPSGTTLVGNSAEWIIERPQLGNAAVTDSLLSDYGLIWMSSEVAFPYGYANSSLFYTPGVPGPGHASTTLTMVDANGNPLAETFPQGTSAQYVNVVGSAY